MTDTVTMHYCFQAGLRVLSAFRLNGGSSAAPPPKRRRSAFPKQNISNKNIICLLNVEDTNKPIAIPRGETRARLTEAGLTGKIAINSCWNAVAVKCEVSNMFASSFGFTQGEMLPYKYLRYAMPKYARAYFKKQTFFSVLLLN